MSKVSCEVIRDLIPLYYDKVCSEESMKIVEEHIEGCAACRKELGSIGEELSFQKEDIVDSEQKENVINGMAQLWKKYNRKSFIKGVSCSLIVVVLFVGYYCLFKFPIIPVPTDVIDISDLYIDESGIVYFDYKFTDGKKEYLSETTTEGNEVYTTFYRPIIPFGGNSREQSTRVGIGIGLVNEPFYSYYYDKESGQNIQSEVKAIYVGTPEDRVLIWEEGMDLPGNTE